ncbi:3-chloro-4-hydroxyphenylacetate reductive dehalogenase precursor [Nereida ignava]|uniref:3-chloro-4-hydroxyphenylacetate reductive dehalogenase n=1 Tax=Nereida ignava TaxID=282199 RepID=A0A0U1NJZ4_9RHOB|nr:2Fe-2S iron-sulfur cluster-binding protein [Nereida ignava]CRK75054.1 3-chloro-4-hydroxyphenylacetate reductive dehalogenase precursor [Nereida ignava]SFJ02871.1 reductive dehalogenase [Nereida ignava DSM 16309]
MTVRFFSDKTRPIHMGPYPSELLARGEQPMLRGVPKQTQLTFTSDKPHSVINAMREHQAMLDAIRDGLINRGQSDIPSDIQERADHLKAFGFFNDAAAVGICRITDTDRLVAPFRNPDIDRLAHDLQTRQTKSLASGIDMIMADLKDSVQAPVTSIDDHTHAIVFLYENPRDILPDEIGTEWIEGAYAHRAALLAAESATVIANYLRVLGQSARAHTASTSDVDLGRLSVSAGLTTVENGALTHPYVGTRFGLAVVTTSLDLAVDRPLVPLAEQPKSAFGIRWKLGTKSAKNALNAAPFAKRRFVDGAHPFETLKRVDDPTTYIDEARVARVPKRTDMFARAQFGDMGKPLQKASTGGLYVRKSAPSSAQRRALGAFVLLQDGVPAAEKAQLSPTEAANLVKATSYFLGVDAVGISRCPDWTWYSHDATGAPITPTHDQAISTIVDQGYPSMEGSSGDDWIAVAQSMRAYLRFSLLGGVLAKQIRNLGYSAKAHTVMDGEVLQPPLLLLAGLGEVSRIGEVILNPFLGPRLKSGVVTTDLPLSHDKPIDFGLQNFCNACNKCARECPSGAITAGPKLMFNGYEIWKSDSQKCTTYRVTTPGGAMCGRCMKTCPWNLEGVFKEKPFRWAAMNVPKAAPLLAKLDDAVGNGGLNSVKKWWWDLEITEDGGYRPTDKPVNARDLQKDLDLKYEDQTLAVYPANLAPHPYPYPFEMDREAGIKAYRDMITADAYKAKLAGGEVAEVAHTYTADGDSPVIEMRISKVEKMTADIAKYEFTAADGSPLPAWQAGAHLDVLVSPEYLRQYSMSGNPADRSTYQIGVLREDDGRGGSKLMHRIFEEGRRVFVSPPINHFALEQTEHTTLLFGGGIGITPMIAMAHELHAEGRPFALHYSGRTRASMAYLDDLVNVPWASHVQLHITDEGTRVNLDESIPAYERGMHIYTCGSEAYMKSVIQSAAALGFPEEARHLEYFSVPEQPDYVNEPFAIKLNDGRTLAVPKDKTAADVLNENGIRVDVKCLDGICGVCKCGVKSGHVEHRDFVLSKAQRADTIILCQSRAAEKDGVLEIDL